MVEAIQFIGSNWRDLELWYGCSAVGNNINGEFQANALQIETKEGTMMALIGDWIIRGVKGEVYPCKLDIFEATYEAVE